MHELQKWRAVLSPLWRPEAPPELFRPPDAERFLRESLPLTRFADLWEETKEWLRLIFRPRWIPEALEDCMRPMREAFSGRDAFLGGWACPPRSFQVAVTHDCVHVLTRRLPTDPGDALILALELFTFPETPDPVPWTRYTQSGIERGYLPRRFYRTWMESLYFQTDGSGIQYSFTKIVENTSSPKGAWVEEELPPWFSVSEDSA